MKVEYIYHSGFTLETENYFLVFDYYKGDIKFKDKKTIVFSTHGHRDHFNPDIFKWLENNPYILYVLSSDIETIASKNIYIMDAYEELKLHDVKISSFGSTDLGLSLLINVDGESIFYAGDLNWWHWDEDSREEKRKMEDDFKSEIAKIKKNDVDVMFFPVDPRLDGGFYLGGEYAIKELKPRVFFPMHFGDKYSVIPEFIHKINNNSVDIIEITKRNEVFKI